MISQISPNRKMKKRKKTEIQLNQGEVETNKQQIQGLESNKHTLMHTNWHPCENKRKGEKERKKVFIH